MRAEGTPRWDPTGLLRYPLAPTSMWGGTPPFSPPPVPPGLSPLPQAPPPTALASSCKRAESKSPLPVSHLGGPFPTMDQRHLPQHGAGWRRFLLGVPSWEQGHPTRPSLCGEVPLQHRETWLGVSGGQQATQGARRNRHSLPPIFQILPAKRSARGGLKGEGSPHLARQGENPPTERV